MRAESVLLPKEGLVTRNPPDADTLSRRIPRVVTELGENGSLNAIIHPWITPGDAHPYLTSSYNTKHPGPKPSAFVFCHDTQAPLRIERQS